MEQLHKNVRRGFEKEGKLPRCDVYDPDFSGALRLQLLQQTSPLYEFINAEGCVQMYVRKQSDICMERNEVIFCSFVSLTPFIPLVCPPSLLQFQFIIWKPDIFAPPPCLSSRLHSAENCFNLHLSASNPILSVYLSVYCALSPAPDLTKTIQTVTLPLSGFTLISTQLWKKSQYAAVS